MKWRENALYKERTDAEMFEKIHLYLNDKVTAITQMSLNCPILLTA
jgi:hypothetical protein